MKTRTRPAPCNNREYVAECLGKIVITHDTSSSRNDTSPEVRKSIQLFDCTFELKKVGYYTFAFVSGD